MHKITHKVGNNIFIKFLVIVLGLTTVACLPKQEQEPRIRIVDLQGKSRSVVTRAPILNDKALMMQREAANQGQYAPQESQNNASYSNQGQSGGNLNYGQVSSDIMQNTLQPTQNAPQGQNPIVALKNDSKRPEIHSSIEYDLSDAPEVEQAPVKQKAKPVTKRVKKKFIVSTQQKNNLFVQVGSFSSSSNANKTLAKMQKFHKGIIEKVEENRVFYRVILGPFTSKRKATLLMTQIKESGHDAVLMRKK